jgi:glycosyltransferase involved in cell wall biosynthesis
MHNLFTVIIPCKNEENYIGELLQTISEQTVRPSKIIIADANSTDATFGVIYSFTRGNNPLNIEVIEGGNVSYGRNKGAELSDTKYLVFIDADMELKEKTLLEKTIQSMEEKSYDMATTNIYCSSSSVASKFVYVLNNVGQKLSKLIKSPFSTGAYMCITKEKFNELGGFDEEIQFSEDYWLSKQIDSKKFGIVKSKIYTSNRRFKKMGHLWMVKNFVKSYFNRNNREYFTKDFKYWV